MDVATGSSLPCGRTGLLLQPKMKAKKQMISSKAFKHSGTARAKKAPLVWSCCGDLVKHSILNKKPFLYLYNSPSFGLLNFLLIVVKTM